MKKLIFLLSFTVLVCNCSKDNNSQDNDGKVKIKGTISAKGAKKLPGKKGTEVFTIADAKKVMIFRGSEYTISNIIDSTFSVSADAGTTNALAFLNSDNKFIGLLCTQGLNVLPLVGLADGDNTIIDLQTLTMPGDSIVPMHNPFGDEINLSPAELESLRAVGSYYEALAKNIDSDNNGELDILVKKQISLIFHFNLYIGKMGLDKTPPDVINDNNLYINYGIELSGGAALSPVSNNSILTGPEGDESTDIKLWGFANVANGREQFLISFNRQGIPIPNSPMGNNFLPFKKGVYTFTPYPGTNLKLHFSNIAAEENLIIVTPTLKTDGNGKIVSVSFTYALADHTPVDPENLISDFMLQFINTENKQFLVVRPVPDHGYYKFTFPTPVELSTFKGMDLFYYDLLGNYYNNNWSK